MNLLSLQFSKGDGWVLLAAFSFAMYNTLVKKKPQGITGISFLFTVFLFGTILLIPFFLWERNVNPAIVWNMNLIWIILYLGAGASVISFLIWNKAIVILGAGRTALFGNLIPVFSSLEAMIFLHEEFTMVHVISAVLVLAGLLIANFNSLNTSK
jgi:drug/metabolite transporter (DMT)-like permease